MASVTVNLVNEATHLLEKFSQFMQLKNLKSCNQIMNAVREPRGSFQKASAIQTKKSMQ